MPASGRKPVAEPRAGTSPVVVTCGGRRCRALRSETAATVLRTAVRETSGAVLIRSQGCLGPCVWAPVALVTPRSDPDGGPLPATLLGPLHRPADVRFLADWVREGGPAAAPLPAPLRDLQRRDLA